MPLEPGEPVPPVSADTQDGDRVTVDFAAPTVLFFYPEDGTPGCTTEASQFDRELETYREAGVAVYGVSTDDADAHAAFATDEDLDVTLLADPDARIVEAFDVERDDQGRAKRTTFACAEAQVCGLYEGVRPDGHARNVLADMLDTGLVTLDE
ncbi:peroxiredoxin [Halobacteriales archaeon Cl-PHB]